MLRKLRIGLGLLVLAVSILFLVWGSWPAHRETRIRPVSFPSSIALPEKHILTLTYPPRLRGGEVGVVRLTLGVDEQGNLAPTAPAGGEGQEGGSPDIYQTHKVTAEARFDLPGLSVRPSDLSSAPIARGQTAVFYWTLRPRGLEKGRGTIWLYLRTEDRQTGEERRETVSTSTTSRPSSTSSNPSSRHPQPRYNSTCRNSSQPCTKHPRMRPYFSSTDRNQNQKPAPGGIIKTHVTRTAGGTSSQPAQNTSRQKIRKEESHEYLCY